MIIGIQLLASIYASNSMGIMQTTLLFCETNKNQFEFLLSRIDLIKLKALMKSRFEKFEKHH